MYPPILESQRHSIPAGTPNPDSTQESQRGFQIRLQMPRTWRLEDIGHVQVLIRRQLTLESMAALSLQFSPDREVIYLPASALESAGDPRYRVINILPIHLGRTFEAGDENEGQTYTIQVRFGLNPLWHEQTPAIQFAAWRNTQVAQTAFGEWSNVQRMFVFYGNEGQIFPTPTALGGILAGFNWEYKPQSVDPLARARVSVSYTAPNGRLITMSKNVPFRSEIGDQGVGGDQSGRWGAAGEVDLGIAALRPISCHLTLITVNNTVAINEVIIPIFEEENVFGLVRPRQVVGEEIEDGLIAMDFLIDPSIEDFNSAIVNQTARISFFRIDLMNLETVQIDEEYLPSSWNYETNSHFVTRDYTIEMGGLYAYCAIGYNSAGVISFSFGDVSEITENLPYLGTSRNLNFHGISFLTTKLNQLRLQGNVQVRNFNRVVSDQVTQTIGGEYPFVTRTGQSQHRTLSVNALISVGLDPTHTFASLTNKEPVWWKEGLEMRREYFETPDGREYSKVPIADNEDFFSSDDISENTIRINRDGEDTFEKTTMINMFGPNGINEAIDEELPILQNVPGPLTHFSPSFRKDITPIRETERVSERIFIERRFREEVMRWLTDGKPKLFRSETEGNMIVAVTGVSFSPFNTSREVYSFSATLTEIAEYTLKNLVLYDLIPSDFGRTFAGDPAFLENPAHVPQKSLNFFPQNTHDPMVRGGGRNSPIFTGSYPEGATLNEIFGEG